MKHLQGPTILQGYSLKRSKVSKSLAWIAFIVKTAWFLLVASAGQSEVDEKDESTLKRQRSEEEESDMKEGVGDEEEMVVIVKRKKKKKRKKEKSKKR